jgi:hypothetical protein
MAMAAMNMVSAGGFSGVSFHLERCPQGVASVLCKKTPIVGFRRSKLDHLTVLTSSHLFVDATGKTSENSDRSYPTHSQQWSLKYCCDHSLK